MVSICILYYFCIMIVEIFSILFISIVTLVWDCLAQKQNQKVVDTSTYVSKNLRKIFHFSLETAALIGIGVSRVSRKNHQISLHTECDKVNCS